MFTDVFFDINCEKYVAQKRFHIVRPASINNPKDNSVMFITKRFAKYVEVFYHVKECLIFWPIEWVVPKEIKERNAVVKKSDPHLSYCEFFEENCIDGLYSIDEVENINGALIAKTAKIGRHTKIFPLVYIGGQVTIGDNCFIGSGVKIVGNVKIGNNVRIRENTVIGTDGLSTDRNDEGRPITMPQFGGVIIEDNVQIGANSVIQRGAIDNTILHQGCKIDGMSFIAHNTEVGIETFVVGETFMLGSSSVGDRSQIAAGCTLDNYVHIGNNTLLGMNSLATKDIPDNCVAYGTPAKKVR